MSKNAQRRRQAQQVSGNVNTGTEQPTVPSLDELETLPTETEETVDEAADTTKDEVVAEPDTGVSDVQFVNSNSATLTEETPVTPTPAPVESKPVNVQNKAAEVTPVVEPVVVNLEKEAQDKQQAFSEAELTDNEVISQLDTSAQMDVYGILAYISEMSKTTGPTRLVFLQNRGFVENLGPQMQAKFYNHLMSLINRTTDHDFTLAMDYVMSLFRKLGGKGQPLNILNLNLFIENLPLDNVGVQCYPNLMRMLTLLADPTTRQVNMATQINIDQTLSVGFTEQGAMRLKQYFNS